MKHLKAALRPLLLFHLLLSLAIPLWMPTPASGQNYPCVISGKMNSSGTLVISIRDNGYTGNFNQDQPTIYAGTMVSFNDSSRSGYTTSNAPYQYDSLTKTWSFYLASNNTGYSEIIHSGGIDLDGRSGNTYCSENDEHPFKLTKDDLTLPQQGNMSNCDDATNSIACQDINTSKCDTSKDSPCAAQIKCRNSANYDRCIGTWECRQEKGKVYTALFKNSEGSSCFTLQDFIPTLLSYFMMFAAIIAGFLFIWASYKYLTSKGDPSALAEARDMIMQVVIGLVILMLAYVIIQVLGSAFSGVDDSIQIWRPDMFKQE